MRLARGEARGTRGSRRRRRRSEREPRRRPVAVAAEAGAVARRRRARCGARSRFWTPAGVERRVDVDEVDRPGGTPREHVEVVGPDDQAGRTGPCAAHRRRRSTYSPIRGPRAMLEAAERWRGFAMVLLILRLARPRGWAALVAACAAAVACSSSRRRVPQAFVAATVGVGAQSSPNAPVQLRLPAAVARRRGRRRQRQTPDDAGRQHPIERPGPASTCTVSTSGDGFDISLNVVSRAG